MAASQRQPPETFSVSMMARETPSVMATVLRHYRRLGARQILVFFDGPAEEIPRIECPGVRLIACDDAFWRSRLGRTPKNFTEKQRVTSQAGLEMCASDWLLIVDADEFLIVERPVGETLAEIPKDVDVVRVPNVEAVWGPEDRFGTEFGCTYLRSAVSGPRMRLLLWLVYGSTSRLFSRGLAGHSQGKQFLRNHRRYDVIDPHTTSRGNELIGRWIGEVLPKEHVYVAHFDAISIARWSEKCRRRFSGEASLEQLRAARLAQVDLAANASALSEDEVETLCRRLHSLTRWQYALLALFGIAFRTSPVQTASRE